MNVDSHTLETIIVIVFRPSKRREVNTFATVKGISHINNGGNTVLFQIWEKDVIIKLQEIVMEQLRVLPTTKVLIGDNCNLH